MSYSERDSDFLITIERPFHLPLNLSRTLKGSISLVFPKNHHFIRKAPKRDVRKLKKHGWDLEQTLFFELPYVMSFSQNLTPALVGAFVLDVVPKNAYFRCLVLTAGYISNSHKIELEDTVIHEKIHMIENERDFRRGNINASDPFLEKEKEVVKTTHKRIKDKYGSTWEDIMQKSTVFGFRVQSRKHTIMSGFLEYWLLRYLNHNYARYNQYANKLTGSMMASLEKLNPQFERKIKKYYNDNFNFTIPEA